MSNNGEPLDRSLARAWGDLHSEMWRLSYNQRGAWSRLQDAVEGLAGMLADRLALDELGRTPAEVEAEAARLAALEALGDGDEGEPADEDDSPA